MGTDHLIHSNTQDVVKKTMTFTQGCGVDMMIENVGNI